MSESNSSSSEKRQNLALAVLKFLGSIQLGIVVMTILAVAMGWATFLEREMGTPVAQAVVYASNWFYFLVGLLCANVLFAAISRLPKLFVRVPDADGARQKTRLNGALVPFFLAHLGVPLLILGCLTTAKYSVKARATISETAAVEKAIETDSRLFEIEIRQKRPDASSENAPDVVEIPFSGGPLNWRDLDSSENWKRDVADPLLEQKPDGNFFQKLAKNASKLSRAATFRAARFARKAKPGPLFEKDGLKLEILDYSVIDAPVQVPPLKGVLQIGDEKNPFELFAPVANLSNDDYLSGFRSRRQTLAKGARVVYQIAESRQEFEAFENGAPALESRPDDKEFSNDWLVLFVDDERFQKPIADLALLSRYGDLDAQSTAFQIQREEIARRLNQERERTDVPAEERDAAKPLATTTRDDLVAQSDKLRELSDKMTSLADEATEPGAPSEKKAEFAKARDQFERERVLNYLATTWFQLESATPTSKEFCETLERMSEANDARIKDVEKLVEATKLGSQGWKIVGFEITPTLIRDINELQGWTALLRLQDPNGEICEATFFSELPERAQYPKNGRVYGGIWLERSAGDDNEYGRPWSKALGEPKLELMQDSSGAVAYRYNDGKNDVQTGRLALSPVPEKPGAFKVDPVQLKGASFSIPELTLHDEIGYRVEPTLFDKNLANEFYGKVRVRVTLDDVEETFLLRTIPLESVDESQIARMERVIASRDRIATVRLTDKELDLGNALYVKKFDALYEPGSSTPASFSSVVRVLPKGLTRKEQREEAQKNLENDSIVKMNRPGTLRANGKTFWAYQDSFRGPYKPGDSEFDDVVQAKLIPGETKPRESIYQTILSLNYDPGRGMKYLGSLLIVWGTALLVYRRKKPARAAKENPRPVDCSDSATRSGRAATSLLLALAAACALLASARALRADEIVPPEKRSAKPALPDDKRLDWSTWRLMPVYDGGRRQPLNTFAEILVRETTGSSRPTIRLPEEVLKTLESDKPLNFPTLQEFLRDLDEDAAAKGESKSKPDDATRKERENWYKEVSAKAVASQKETAARLRAIFPKGARKFDAPELLFSWIVEPELWECVPFIADPKGVVAKKVLKRTDAEIAQRAGRLAPADFDLLDYGGKTRVETFKSLARTDSNLESASKALAKFEDKLAAFRSVAFVPTRSLSSRPSRYLNKILYGEPGSGMMGMGVSGSPSELSKLDDAAANLERLLSKEKRATRKDSPFNDKEYLLRKRVSVEGARASREPLALARQMTMLSALARRGAPTTLAALLERQIVELTKTLDELKAHRDKIFAEEKFSDDYRRELQRAVVALQDLVDDLELVQLSLVSETPKTLNITPVVRRALFRASESQDSPWVPLQTVLFAPDPAYARFVDPGDVPAIELNDDGTPVLPKDAEKIDPFDNFPEALRKTIANGTCERKAAKALLDAALAYRDREATDRAARFNDAIRRFSQEIAALAARAEEKRVELAALENPDEKSRAEFLAKTSRDVPRGLKAELFYYRLNAFYWNWIACLLALVSFALSYARQIVWRRSRKERDRDEKFFYALGLLFLVASCVVAFLGGAVRAYITGWAPVANMFETVVLLAFLIASIAVGFALAPAWKTPYLNAWRATAFPWKVKDRSDRTVALVMFLPRLILIALCFFVAFKIWRAGSESAPIVAGLIQTLKSAFAMKGALDSFAVLLTFLFVVWSVPRFLVALAALLCFPKTTWRRDDLSDPEKPKSKKEIREEIASEIYGRKAFITASAAVALAVSAAAYFNSVEFNPNIRPLVAVLRSNFWLTIHVVAIIVSYALGAIAWFVALSSLIAYVFGKYGDKPSKPGPENPSKRDSKKARGALEKRAEPSPEPPTEFDPPYSIKVAPAIVFMLRGAVLFLTAGIILGARWADFSWGRFWSWDPKEVWALVTLLIYLVVLHARAIWGAKRFVAALGANFGALAIIMTWYGLSFVMGGGGRHAYASGESNKVAALCVLFAIDILCAVLALARYWFERAIRRAARKAAEKKR